MNEDRWVSFKARLDIEHAWPGPYTLKVVAPVGQVDEVLQLMARPEHHRRESTAGKYVSLTFEWKAQGSDEVLDCYRRLSAVEGVVLL